MSNTFITIRFSDVFLDHNDIYNYAKPYIYSETFQSSVTIYKRIYFSFKMIDYFSDENILLNDYKLNSFVSISDYKEAIDLRPLNTTIIPNTF